MRQGSILSGGGKGLYRPRILAELNTVRMRWLLDLR